MITNLVNTIKKHFAGPKVFAFRVFFPKYIVSAAVSKVGTVGRVLGEM